jgi:hypothetical protein
MIEPERFDALGLEAEWASFKAAAAAFDEINRRVAADRVAGHILPASLMLRYREIYKVATIAEERLKAGLRDRIQHFRGQLP